MVNICNRAFGPTHTHSMAKCLFFALLPVFYACFVFLWPLRTVHILLPFFSFFSFPTTVKCFCVFLCLSVWSVGHSTSGPSNRILSGGVWSVHTACTLSCALVNILPECIMCVCDQISSDIIICTTNIASRLMCAQICTAAFVWLPFLSVFPCCCCGLYLLSILLLHLVFPFLLLFLLLLVCSLSFSPSLGKCSLSVPNDSFRRESSSSSTHKHTQTLAIGQLD